MHELRVCVDIEILHHQGHILGQDRMIFMYAQPLGWRDVCPEDE